MPTCHCTKCGIVGNTKCCHCRNIFPDSPEVDAIFTYSNVLSVELTGDELMFRLSNYGMPTTIPAQLERLKRILARFTVEQLLQMVCDHEWVNDGPSSIGCGHKPNKVY